MKRSSRCHRNNGCRRQSSREETTPTKAEEEGIFFPDDDDDVDDESLGERLESEDAEDRMLPFRALLFFYIYMYINAAAREVSPVFFPLGFFLYF